MKADISFFESPSAAERLTRAEEFVGRYPPSTEILIIGSSREASDDFVRSIAGDASFGLHRLSFTQLAARLAEPELVSGGIVPATRLSAEALATLGAYELRAQNSLRYFAPVSGFPGFARSLVRTINELRLAGLHADAVRVAGDAGTDLARLLSMLDEQLAVHRLADRSLLFSAAISAVSDGGGKPWIDMPILLLDVEIRSKAEVNLVRALLSRAPGALATVPSGDETALRALESIAARPAKNVVDPVDSSSLVRLKKYLFAEEAPVNEPDDSVRMYSAPGEGRESVEIARFILDEARAGRRFDDIAVFVRAPASYTSHLQTAFRRAGIPPYFARGTLRLDPAGRAFLALLNCAAEGISAHRFAEYLSFAQVPNPNQSGTSPKERETWQSGGDEALGLAAEAARAARIVEPSPAVDDGDEADDDSERAVRAGSLRAPWRWEALLVDAAVIGGVDRWRRRLNGLAYELRASLSEIEREEAESPQAARLRREIEELQHLEHFAIPIVERLDAMRQRTSWGSWLQQLSQLALMVLRWPERVLRVLADLEPLASVGNVEIAQVCEVLTERLSFLEEDPPAQRFGRVFIGTPELARGRSFSVVFVPGLAEHVFPQRPREDPLLLDHARNEISDWLETQDQRGSCERLLLRLAVGAARERIYLSYPRIDALQGRARVTSFYGLDVARAVRGEIPPLEHLEREADALTGARLAWPAPPDPSRAIDPVEHDLAVLRNLLHLRDPSQGKGRAQYLVELHDCLGRSLRSRFARWQQKSWSEFDGLVKPTAEVKEVLVAHRLGARPYSPSALEKFAVCPYRFLLHAIHRLEPRREVGAIERLDPLTRGKLFHEVQAETLLALRNRRLLPLTVTQLDEATRILSDKLDDIAARYFDDLAPAITRVWDDEMAALRADLLAWLKALERDVGWQPQYFEFAFGLPKDPARDPASVDEPVRLAGGALLRGAVDLVEKSAHLDLLRVTDHKTGTNRTLPGVVIGGGATLQPVLYGLAVEAVLGKRVTESRVFFCTSKGGFAEAVVMLDDQARGLAKHVLDVIDNSIADGVLLPVPAEGACESCDFRIVCGPYEEDRARGKRRDLLKQLDELRTRP